MQIFTALININLLFSQNHQNLADVALTNKCDVHKGQVYTLLSYKKETMRVISKVVLFPLFYKIASNWPLH